MEEVKMMQRGAIASSPMGVCMCVCVFTVVVVHLIGAACPCLYYRCRRQRRHYERARRACGRACVKILLYRGVRGFFFSLSRGGGGSRKK